MKATNEQEVKSEASISTSDQIKQSIPDSIPEIQIFISVFKEKLRKLQGNPDRDIKPFNQSHKLSVAILYGEAKIGRLLEEAGTGKDEQLSLAGIKKHHGDFYIKLSKYEQFIDEAMFSVIMSGRIVSKREFSKASPNGDKILQKLINKKIASDLCPSEEDVELRYSEDINIKDVQKIAGPDFDQIWDIFHMPHDEVVTWTHVFQQAFWAGEF